MAFSVGAWAVFVAALLLRWVVNKSRRAKAFGPFFIIPAGLTAIAGAALAEIVLGEWLAQVFEAAAGYLGDVINTPAGVILGLATVIGSLIVIFGLADLRADQLELQMLLLLPTLFVAASGVGFSEEGSQLAQAVFNFGQQGLSSLLN